MNPQKSKRFFEQTNNKKQKMLLAVNSISPFIRMIAIISSV
ncbi:hypothetical protein RV10_GL000349 [Enterococcus pallens]|nr:hypothetical protein RV10_GL000349 [Enterococcus pallens]